MECPTCNDTFNVGDSYTVNSEGQPIRCIHLRFEEPQSDSDVNKLVDLIYNI
jgi:hypothetical protein